MFGAISGAAEITTIIERWPTVREPLVLSTHIGGAISPYEVYSIPRTRQGQQDLFRNAFTLSASSLSDAITKARSKTLVSTSGTHAYSRLRKLLSEHSRR